MDTPTRQYGPGDLRVSDADRDRAVTELSGHFQAGRLTLEEFDERSSEALRAKTARDLAGLFTDLPTGPGQTAGIGNAVAVPDAGPRRPATRAWAAAATLSAVVIVVLLLARIGVGHHTLVVPVPLIALLFIVRLLIFRCVFWGRSRRRRALPDATDQDR
jgi:Flp pilus assembly protein TadB